MGKKKKIISLIVSVAMLVAMFPMIVHADEEPGSFTELQELINKRAMPTIEKDYEWKEGDSSLTWSADMHFGGIDLNGHTIDAKGQGTVITVGAGEIFYIAGSGTIRGGSGTDGAGIRVEEGGTLQFTGGNLVQNSATGNGGGIYNAGTVELGDCVISANSAATGSGIYNLGTIRLQGNAMVIGNTGDDLYLSTGTKIDLTGDSNGAIIGVATEQEPSDNAPVVFTSGLPTNASETNFISNDGYTIGLNGDGELQMEGSGSGIQEDPVKLKGCTVTLGGMLGVNIFVDFGTLEDSVKEASTVKVAITGKGGKEQVYSYSDGFDGEIQGANYHGYTYEISSIQMADEITVIVSYDGQTTEFAPFTVESYIVAMYKNFQSYGLTNDQLLLIRRFNDYGYYVQKYLDSINDGWSIEAGDHTAMTAPYFSYNSGLYDYVVNATNDTASVTYQPIKVVDENSKITKVTYSLEFGTTIALEIFFTVEAGTEFSASATCASTGKTYRAYLADDGRYKIRISGILVQELGNMFVSVTGTAGSDFTLDVHPFGYINKAVKSSSTLKKDAMTALYFFYDAASSAN